MVLPSLRLPALIAWILMLLPYGAASATDYTTYHFDNARDGWNNHETVLTQTSARRIEKIGDFALDGEVDAQPLYFRRVIYVVTENDTLYAFDPVRGPLWKRNFGKAVGANYAGNCRATAPTIGITSTPVIDRSTGTLYLVAYTLVDGKPTYTLQAVSASTGAQIRSVDLSARVVNTYVHRQRAGLLESNGLIYVAFAGFCDHHADTTYGRVLAYSTTNLAFKYGFVTTASPRCGGFHMGTIWAEGFAPAADSQGNLYFATGNGCIDYARLPDGGYGDAVLRLTPELKLNSTTAALFAPCNAVNENFHDQEMGSGGVLLSPEGRFAIAGGKNGTTYVLNRADFGGFHTPCPDRVAYEAVTNWGIWGGPVAWRSAERDYIAIPGTGPYGVRAYEVDARSGKLTLRSQTGELLRNGGESAIVTSDERGSAQSLVLWVLTRPTTGVMYLRAYNALNLRERLLSVPAGSWGNSGGYAGVSPTVADGYVFVATDKRLTVWGNAMPKPIAMAIRTVSLWFVVPFVLLAATAVIVALPRRSRRPE